jgi:hypothetical protein
MDQQKWQGYNFTSEIIRRADTTEPCPETRKEKPKQTKYAIAGFLTQPQIEIVRGIVYKN